MCSEAPDKDSCFEEKLAEALRCGGDKLSQISEDIEEWIDGVGRMRGERMEVVMEDITRELFEKEDPPKDYLRNCRTILEVYAPEYLARGEGR